MLSSVSPTAGLSKLDDPEWRRERAKKAAAARVSPSHHARELVKSWPALDEATKAEVRALLIGAEVREALLSVAPSTVEAA